MSVQIPSATVPLLLWADIVHSSLLADAQLYAAGAKAAADADSDDDDWDMSKSKGGMSSFAALCSTICHHMLVLDDAAELHTVGC